MPGYPDLDSYVARLVGARKAFLILGGLTLVTELVRTGGPRPAMIALIVLPVAVGLHAVWRFQRHPTSARALLWMVDACGLAFSVQLPLALVLAAAKWAHNFWLYQHYWYAYVAAAFLSAFGLALFLRARNRGIPQRQAGMLRAAAAAGQLDAQQFYEILMLAPGARQALAGWGTARFQAIMGPVSVATLVIVVATGGDGMLYASFLGAVLVSPMLVLASVRGRLLVHRGLGARDLVLTAY